MKTNPARFWTRFWPAAPSKLFARAASGPSARRAMVRPGLLAVLLLVIAPVCLFLSQSGLHASGNTITVNTTDDPGSSTECSLRAAINNANNKRSDANSTCAAGTGQDTINFSLSGEITLSSALPAIANSSPGSLTIDATGQAISINGFNSDTSTSVQILTVNSGATLTLKYLTIAKGNGGGSGGAIVNNGSLTVSSSTVTGSTAPSGMNGGGIYNLGTLIVSNSSFSKNSASADGGAIFNNGGTLTITNSTFSTNSAGSSGGGIYNSGGATIGDSTFSGNSSASGGGAVFHNSGTLGVTNSTLSGNSDTSSGGGIDNAAASGSVTVTNSILSSNTNGNCVGSSVTNGGTNIADDATCGFGSSLGASGQTIGDNVNPLLVPNPLLLSNQLQFLQYYGGPTQTIALQSGSPAIAAVAPGNCPAADQRGATRPAPGQSACDAGAFELGGLAPSGNAPVEFYAGSAFEFSNSAAPGSPENITINSTTGVQAGDLVLVGLLTYQNGGCGSGSAYTINPPSGFTAVSMASGTNPIFNWDTGNGVAEVFQKTAGASEPSSYTFSVANPCTSSTELQADYGITVWSNVGSTPVDTASENVTDCGFGTNCSVVASAVTTTAANEMLVPMYFAGNREPNWTCTLPGGFNTAWSFQDDQFSITCAGYNSQSVIGSTGDLTGDLSGFGVNPSAFPALAFLVAVAPGTVSGSPTPTATATSTTGATPTQTATSTPTATATASATQSATLTATPTSTATATATATVTATQTATSTATATPTATPTTTVSVTVSLAFGNVALGQTPTKNLTVHNTGATHSLIITSATSSDPAEYALSGTGTCGPIPITVAPKTTCTLGVAFTPSAPGTHNATLMIFDNATTSPQHSTLTGTGIAGLTLSKSSLVFGSVKFGIKPAGSFSVTNHQTQAVALSDSFSGTNAADFTVTGGTCTTTLGADNACSIIVTFKPGALGTESATLSVSDSPDPLSPYPVAISTGPTIPATVTPASIAFGTLKTTSKTLSATVTNLSGFALPLSESFSGTNASDFTVAGGTCGAIAAANSSCTIAVKFTPTGGGSAESASMAVNVKNDPTSPHSISLSGTGP